MSYAFKSGGQSVEDDPQRQLMTIGFIKSIISLPDNLQKNLGSQYGRTVTF